MMFVSVILCLSLFSNIIYATVPFILNPDCDLLECEQPDYPALYYANHIVDDNKIHIIYSTLDELTISIFQTGKNYMPIFNYTALFSRNYPGAIQFVDTKPTNSFSLVLRRLIKFDDINDEGNMAKGENITSYFLHNITTNNVTISNSTNQPTFQLPLPMLNGSLNIDVMYPGEAIRETKSPKLRTTSKSYFLNIALQANNFTSAKTRFAFELYLILPGVQGSQKYTSRYIDDHFTPGIFNVYQIKTLDSLYSSSMLWKPVVYQSEDRSVEQSTLMQIYDIKNNVTLDPNIDQGTFYSLLSHPFVSAFNLSIGQAKDGFFAKTNYTFIQFTAGLDYLEPDSTKVFVTVALIASLALPALVAIVALIFILRRRFSRQTQSSYNAIDD
ncbi:unnamed protein product [Rotaria sordida]|uniref:Uncharacterized protein n=1 Tax=Rotaria sordida TaxID=392033 RepID=A0A814I6T8_9BILA|nr:unnamed protein product [Rotaria sordida]CAF1130854.1 unnamed protein product [Rotaria sordida]